MQIRPRTEPYILFFGDVILWTVALWLALFLRDFSLPSGELFILHLTPFLFIFILWAGVFFIADLYKTPTILAKQTTSQSLFYTQIANSIIAIFFFYFIPYFGITPKIVLFIDLVISFVLLMLWRLFIAPRFNNGKKKVALLIGSGPDVDLLLREVNEGNRYNFIVEHKNSFVFNEVIEAIERRDIRTIIIDTKTKEQSGVTRELYDLLFANVTFIDLHELFEEIFGRIPLSLLHDNWFIENITVTQKRFYDASKRAMDIIIALVLGAVTLLLYPFIILAIYLEDRGTPFIKQIRVGKRFQPVTLYKFRSMEKNDGVSINGESTNRVTRVGNFLRRTRLDELPQLWNVLRGDLSLIGPRPELFNAARVYAEQIPYYPSRLLILPGLSGWAQIYHDAHPHHTADIPETKNKLSYDLYYIKNRSVFLDVKIALKTLRALASRQGR